MSAVLVATSAYGVGAVRQLGQTYFIDIVADAGADGIEIRRELFTSDTPDLARMGQAIADRGLYSVYSAPVELWGEDGQPQYDALREAMAEAAQLGARYLKVSLGHFPEYVDLAPLVAYLAAAPVPLLVENDQTAHGGAIDGMARFLPAVNRAGAQVGMTFDIGNWHWAGVDPEAAAALLAPHVRYVHCKAVSREGGRLTAVPVSDNDPVWRALFSHFAQGVQRAIEFPLAGGDLVALTRRYVDMLAAA
ncbi:MAG: sugar phosphate isomerase/epimerase [Pseudomonadota bacterium]